jgi:hypothetical protein
MFRFDILGCRPHRFFGRAWPGGDGVCRIFGKNQLSVYSTIFILPKYCGSTAELVLELKKSQILAAAAGAALQPPACPTAQLPIALGKPRFTSFIRSRSRIRTKSAPCAHDDISDTLQRHYGKDMVVMGSLRQLHVPHPKR